MLFTFVARASEYEAQSCEQGQDTAAANLYLEPCEDVPKAREECLDFVLAQAAEPRSLVDTQLHGVAVARQQVGLHGCGPVHVQRRVGGISANLLVALPGYTPQEHSLAVLSLLNSHRALAGEAGA